MRRQLSKNKGLSLSQTTRRGRKISSLGCKTIKLQGSLVKGKVIKSKGIRYPKIIRVNKGEIEEETTTILTTTKVMLEEMKVILEDQQKGEDQ